MGAHARKAFKVLQTFQRWKSKHFFDFFSPINFIYRKKSKNLKSKLNLQPVFLLDRRCPLKRWLVALKLQKCPERKSKKQKRRARQRSSIKMNRPHETQEQIDHAQLKKRMRTASSSKLSFFFSVYNITYEFHLNPFHHISISKFNCLDNHTIYLTQPLTHSHSNSGL